MKKHFFIPLAILALALLATLWLPYTAQYDQKILDALFAIRTPYLNTLFLYITALGNTSIVLLFLLLSSVFIYKKGKRFELKVILASSPLALGGTFFIKDFVLRPRPYAGFSLVSESSYSFPSAHSVIAVTGYFLVLWTMASCVKNKTLGMVLRVLSVVVCVALAFSRMYVGVHFPSDVVCGVLIGIGAIVSCKTLFKHR